jgi:hypothetical protein
MSTQEVVNTSLQITINFKDSKLEKQSDKVEIDELMVWKSVTLLKEKHREVLCSPKHWQETSNRILGDYSNNNRNRQNLFLSSNFALNELQTSPPFTRKLARLKNGKCRSAAEALYSIDLQVIDIHWLFHYRKNNGSLVDLSTNDVKLFTNQNLTLSEVYQFAQLNWRKTKKIEFLRLSDFEQIICNTLSDKSISDRKAYLYKTTAKYEQTMKNHCDTAKSRLKSEDLPKYMNYIKALKLAKGDIPQATTLHSYIDGTTISKDKDTIKNLTRAMGKRKKKLEAIGFTF